MYTPQADYVKKILTESVKRGAADLHFSVGNMPVLRIDDKLVLMDGQDLITQDLIESWVESLLSKEQKDKLYEKKELILTYDFGEGLRFKINIFYQKGVLSATLRHISDKVPSLKSLQLSKLSGLVKNKEGLIIVSGSFGSGRSTTIAAMIEEINQGRKEYIITIESPIEYIFTNQQSIIEQREVGRDTNTFYDALKYFQEEDGDVLYLEEMIDPKVIPMVLEIARSGSLVFSSVSANSTAETFSRILDSFQSFDQERIRDLLSNSVIAVVCQKLLPKIGGGLVAALEIVTVNDAVREVINSGNLDKLNNIIQTSRGEDMVSFEWSLAKLVQENKISRQDALDYAPDHKRLENFL